MIFHKYQGAGNDFIMIDNRSGLFPKNNYQLIAQMCDRRFGIGADGLILIENDKHSDFKMVYFNSDGKESTMCGNGGRCIVAFAKEIGIIENHCSFSAIDGMHLANINENNTVSLQMIDVKNIYLKEESVFLNTGSPHHIEFVTNLKDTDIYTLGKKIRNSEEYAPQGTNVNFVEITPNKKIYIRTYERGVENETLACGTGVTATAIALHFTKKISSNNIEINTMGGELAVKFYEKDKEYTDIWLTGKAEKVFEGKWNN